MVTRGIRRIFDQKLSTVVVHVGHLDPSYKLLVIKIHSAAGLAKKDIFGLSDPYVKVRIKSGNYQHVMPLTPETTKTVKRTLSPIWNERVCYLISENQFSVFFDVYDENIISKDDHLGRASLHFDLENKMGGDFVMHPTVWEKDGWSESRNATKKCLPLTKKYDDEIQRELCILSDQEEIAYTRQMLSEFQDKGRVTYQKGVQGVVNVSYSFLNPQLPEALVIMRSDCHVHVIGEPVCRPRSWFPVSTDGTAAHPREYRRTESMGSVNAPGSAKPKLTSNASLPNFDSIISDTQRVHFNITEEHDEEDDPLPGGWEKRTDSNGRTVFVDHRTRSASLKRPVKQDTFPAPRNYLPRQRSIVEDHTEITESDHIDTTGSHTDTTGSHTDTTKSHSCDSNPLIPIPTSTQNEEAAETSQAIKHLELGLHPDWKVQLSPGGKLQYFNVITKTTSYDRPKQRKLRGTLCLDAKEHSEIIDTVYLAIGQTSDLPPGWETRRCGDGSGTVYFVDHNSKTTHTTRPGEETEPSTECAIRYSRDYQQKCDNFYATLFAKSPSQTSLEVVVRKEHIWDDSYKCIMEVDSVERLKCPLQVTLQGYSNPEQSTTRMWFQLLSEELFNTYYGFFEHAASDDYTLQVNPDSGKHSKNHLKNFQFIGRILGMAIYHKVLIDAFFICPFYKMLLHQSVNLKDMELVDVELHNTIEYIQQNDPEPLCLKFAINKTVFGEVCEEELKPSGREISVTEDNKEEYINLLIKWRFTQRVQKQMNALRTGVSDIVPLFLLQIFDAREMEYLLGGLAQVDVDDWKKNTELRGYLPTDQVIVWFWKAMENYDDEMKARLLQFVTGTSKVPMNGFAELQGTNGPFKFCIRRKGEIDDLPQSYSCFNRIDLPPYTSYSLLEEKLMAALEQC